jgi:hypothetical protein
MRFSDAMLFLGLSTTVVAPVLVAMEQWTAEGYEDMDGFHYGPIPGAMDLSAGQAGPEI